MDPSYAYTDAETKEATPEGDTLDAAATEIREAVERLAMTFDELAIRLRPVLMEQEPEARVGVVRCATSSSSPLTSYLVETVQRIEALQSHVNDVFRRVNLAR